MSENNVKNKNNEKNNANNKNIDKKRAHTTFTA